MADMRNERVKFLANTISNYAVACFFIAMLVVMLAATSIIDIGLGAMIAISGIGIAASVGLHVIALRILRRLTGE